jgi:ADP-ribose pyrophosphatase YjhB (NUDIX family)
VALDGRGSILLIRRANPPAQGLWSLPGGRVEPGEDTRDAVLRELLEETGVAGEVGPLVGLVRREAPGGDEYVIHDFLVRVASDAPLTAGDDALEAAWFPLEGLAALATSPGLLDALAEWGVLDTGRGAAP